MRHYVLGFAFYNDRVLLFHHDKPENWQHGVWNGIGGKVEPGETPAKAMVREAEEEAGLSTTWYLCGIMLFHHCWVWVFKTELTEEPKRVNTEEGHTDSPPTLDVLRKAGHEHGPMYNVPLLIASALGERFFEYREDPDDAMRLLKLRFVAGSMWKEKVNEVPA